MRVAVLAILIAVSACVVKGFSPRVSKTAIRNELLLLPPIMERMATNTPSQVHLEKVGFMQNCVSFVHQDFFFYS